MGRQREDRDLQQALEEAARAAEHDPDEAQISADDAGGTRLAEAIQAEEEAQAHPS